jgi:hypothetical protein
MSSSPRRVIVYIDGLNLYHGLVAQGWRKYLWLNLHAFALSLLTDSQRLVAIRYFTTEVTAPPDKAQRQRAYLAALRTLPDFTIDRGRYEPDAPACIDCGTQFTCPICRRAFVTNVEKMTDVHIATSAVAAALSHRFDDAILVTGDADQVPTIKTILAARDGKCVFVCFPPSRKSYHLERFASGLVVATEENYRKSQFPLVVDTASGRTVVKPDYWRSR